MAIGNNEPITSDQVVSDFNALQVYKKQVTITVVLSKRSNQRPPTDIERHWEAFETMAPIIHKESPIVHDDPVPPTPSQDPTSSTSVSRSKVNNRIQNVQKASIPTRHQSLSDKQPKQVLRKSSRIQQLHQATKLPIPVIAKVLESRVKPEVPLHIGIALKSPF